MTNETEISNFSNKMVDATKEAIISFTHNVAHIDDSELHDSVLHEEKSNKLSESIPEISTVVNVITEKAEALATSAIQKLVTTTISTSTSMSSNQLSDTSSSSFATFGHKSFNPSNSFSVTDIPVSTLGTTHDIQDTSETVISNASEELVTASNHHAHAMEDSAHQSMQNHIQNLNSPKNIKYLIERLKEKLTDVQGSGPEDLHSLSLPNPHTSGFPNHQQGHEKLPSSVRFAAEDSNHDDISANTHFSNSSKILSNYSNTSNIQLSEYENNNSDNVILHSDTIILVSSMVCMIIMGLVLYKLLGYLTKMNKRKHMARQGLKQIGEHMNVVTRTMSADPSGGNTGSTPKPVRKRPLVDSPSTARVLREVRRGTVFKPPTYVMRRDDDMDFGLAFQTASQAAHLERIRFEEGIELEIQNEHTGNSKHERNH